MIIPLQTLFVEVVGWGWYYVFTLSVSDTLVFPNILEMQCRIGISVCRQIGQLSIRKSTDQGPIFLELLPFIILFGGHCDLYFMVQRLFLLSQIVSYRNTSYRSLKQTAGSRSLNNHSGFTIQFPPLCLTFRSPLQTYKFYT